MDEVLELLNTLILSVLDDTITIYKATLVDDTITIDKATLIDVKICLQDAKEFGSSSN